MNYFLGKDLDADVLERVSQTFKALGDPTRIRILSLLAREECAVNQVADALQLSQSAVSHQLKTLRAYRFVRYRREGQNILYICDDAYILELLNEAVRYALSNNFAKAQADCSDSYSTKMVIGRYKERIYIKTTNPAKSHVFNEEAYGSRILMYFLI